MPAIAKSSEQPRMFLTFDDGPVPHVTNRVLELLEQFDARATFFCLGQQAEKFPQVIRRMQAAGHSIGSHSYSHPNGWATPVDDWLADVQRGADVIESVTGVRPKLFRPPFGRVRRRAIPSLVASYRVVMWDLLSLDYRADCSAEQVGRNVTSNANDGSIALFHDSIVAEDQVIPALETSLAQLTNRGFQLEAIPDDS